MASRPSVTATVEFDSQLAPLARVTLPNRRTGYVHYSTLVARLRHAISQIPQQGEAESALLSGPCLNMLGSAGFCAWPESKVVVLTYEMPVRRIRKHTGELTGPIQLPSVLWALKYQRSVPYRLQLSKLYLCAARPKTLTEGFDCVPYPFGNVHEYNGTCCWGHVPTESLTFEHPDRVDAAWWDARANQDLLPHFQPTLPYHTVTYPSPISSSLLDERTPMNELGIKVVPYTLLHGLAGGYRISRTVEQIAGSLRGD